MRISVRQVLHLLFLVLWGVVFAGWIVCQPESVVPSPRSAGYYLFVIAMAVPFVLPTLMGVLARRAGIKRMVFSLAPVGILLGFAYLTGSFWYYHNQVHLFDPYLQNPPPRFDGLPKEKPGNVLRVLALGGSTTQCGRLALNDRYPEVLGAILEDHYPGLKIQVLNAGKEYYTSQHSLLQYVMYCRDWHPDVVVVLHGINDLCRTFTPGRYGVGRYNDLWTHWYGPAIGAARPTPYEMIMCGSFLARAAERWYYAWRVHAMDYPLEHYLSLPQFERHMRTLVEYLRVDEEEVVLATQPFLYKEDLSPREQRVLKFGRHFSRVTYDYFHQEYPSPKSLMSALGAFNERTRQLARESGVLFADTEAAVPKTLEYFVDDVHFTRAGARRVAETIAGVLLEGGVIDRWLARHAS